jgi:hypothetical protein
LTRFHNFTGSGQLKQHNVGLSLIGGPPSADTKIKIRFLEYLLRVESILTDDVRDLRFRASK